MTDRMTGGRAAPTVTPIERGPIVRPSPEIVAGFRGIGTSTVGNVLDDMGVQGIVLNIKPISPGWTFVGPALTVKEVTGTHGTYGAAEFGLGAVIDSIEPGDVVAIDNGGQQVSTWGGVASFAALRRGCAGLVVDGGVRDADEIRDFGLPVFSRHVVPLSGKTRVKVIALNTVVKIDGVSVAPGDILVGDGSGIVRVPAAICGEVLEASRKLEQDDRRAIEAIRSGLGFTEALARFEKL